MHTTLYIFCFQMSCVVFWSQTRVIRKNVWILFHWQRKSLNSTFRVFISEVAGGQNGCLKQFSSHLKCFFSQWNAECRKKSHRKKSHGKKSQFWVGKKVTGKKVTNIKSFFLLYVRMDFVIFIITNSIKNIFAWVEVLRPDDQFSVMPGWS